MSKVSSDDRISPEWREYKENANKTKKCIRRAERAHINDILKAAERDKNCKRSCSYVKKSNILLVFLLLLLKVKYTLTVQVRQKFYKVRSLQYFLLTVVVRTKVKLYQVKDILKCMQLQLQWQA